MRVHGAGLNRADLAQLAGFYPAPPGSPADIPGLEFAGDVVALGAGVTAPAVGTRVFGIAGGGGQAELLAVPAAQCARVPDALDLVAAGGVPEVFITAHDAMVTQADVAARRDRARARGGLGRRHRRGAARARLRVHGGRHVAHAPTSWSSAVAFGLDHAVLAPRELDPIALADEITAAAGPIDVTIDLVGGPYVEADVRAAARLGRIVLVASQAGAPRRARHRVDHVQAPAHPRNDAARSHARAEGRGHRRVHARRRAAARDGHGRPVIARTFPLDDAREAYDLLAADAVFGKIVLDLALT